MFQHARGRMFDWLERQRDNSDCGLGSPIQHLARHGLLRANVLAVHVNCLATGDTRLLAEQQVSVVHCPRSHGFFSHPKFPYQVLQAAGVNICLGTDSLASMETKRRQLPELNMFSELRSFARKHRGTPPGVILRLATLNAARALGLTGKIGALIPDAFADLIAVPCREKLADVPEAVLHHRGAVSASMINGDWVRGPK